MSVEEILTPVIEQEFEKYESSGHKVRLRSVMKQRILYTLICLLGGCGCFPVAIIVYIFLMRRTGKIKTIIRLAKKFPDKSIQEIVESELQPYRVTDIIGMAIGGICIAGCLIMGLFVVPAMILEDFGYSTYSQSEESVAFDRQEEHTFTAYGDGYKLVCGGSNYMTEESIVIPDQYQGQDVVAIGNSAFAGFDHLQSVEIPESVQTIGGGAFMGCRKLKEVSFGSAVSVMEGECFKGCTSLERIVIPTAVTEIRGNCFEDCAALTEVVLHDGIEAIHGYAFADCKSLSEITLPSKITEVRGNTFENCTSLRSIRIPEGVVRIGGHAFRNCSALSDVSVPGTLKEIGSSAFRECDSLYEIHLPKGASVNERAFKDSPTRIYYN